MKKIVSKLLYLFKERHKLNFWQYLDRQTKIKRYAEEIESIEAGLKTRQDQEFLVHCVKKLITTAKAQNFLLTKNGKNL